MQSPPHSHPHPKQINKEKKNNANCSRTNCPHKKNNNKALSAHFLFLLCHEPQQLLQEISASRVIKEQQVSPQQWQMLKAVLQFNCFQQLIKRVDGGCPEVWCHSLVQLK